MKRLSTPLGWGLAALVVIGGVTWACWPDEVPLSGSIAVDSSKVSPLPARSLSEQIDEAEEEFQASDAGLGRVSGTIEDETGQPVAGAEVRIFRGGGHALMEATCPVCTLPILECTDVHTARELVEVVRAGKGQPRQLAVTTTGPDGVFLFEDLPQDELELTARKGGLIGRGVHSPGEESQVMIFAPSQLLLRVMRGAIDIEAPHVPLAGAVVSAISLDTFHLLQTTSDGSGQLQLQGLDEGSGVWVMIEAPGMATYVGSVYSDQDETEVALTPARALLVRTAIAGKPAETTVTLTSESGHTITQRTQAGSARFDGLGADGYEVSASTDSMVARAQSLSLDDDLTTVDLELRAAARLLVTVIDETGEPVPHADVTASGRGGEFYSGMASDGALVVLGPLGEGTVTIGVTTSEFRPWHRELDLHAGENTLEVVVKKGVKVRGKVVDSEGAPVQASIIATDNQIAGTDIDGTFEITFDEAGPQELTAEFTSAGRATVKVNAPADDVVIRLEPRARLKVFVHSANVPVVAASVTVTAVNGDDTELNTLTEEDGHVTISGLDTGSYRVLVQSSEFRQPPISVVELTEGRTVSLDLALDRGLTLTGVVVDARGAPVPRADVATQPWSQNAVTGEDGHFMLVALDPALTYTIQASSELLHSAALVIKGPQAPLKLVMTARPTASGRVVDAATGAPLTEFEIDSRTVEAPDGRFSVPVNVDGEDRVTISFSAENYATTAWEGTRAASQDLGTVRLEKAKLIEGVVRDARGNPVPGALVTSDYTANEVTSASDGSFRLSLSVYEPGVVLTAQRGQNKGAAAAQVGRLTEIILAAPTKVLGMVVDAAGRPVSGTVTVREANGADELQAEAGNDGSFAIDVAPGRWVFITRVSASGQTFVVAGASMRVVLGAPPGTCAIAVQTPVTPDELMLLPGDSAPSQDAAFEQLAAGEGVVLFDTLSAPRVLRASGFRCGTFTLLARWGSLQRLLRVEIYSGRNSDLQLAAPPELEASAPDLGLAPH